MATPRDYDADPERFRLATRVTDRYLTGSAGQHARVAEMLVGARTVLDIGCGEGRLRAALAGSIRLVGLDASTAMLAAHPPPAVHADAAALPFRDAAFDAAVAINMLYHLDDPLAALREARRVLRPGGLLVAVTPSRHDSPELAEVWHPEPTTFDAEDAPALLESVFDHVEVERWDAPLITLPDALAVRDYLIARQVPPEAAEDAAVRVRTPVILTKRGAFLRARVSG